MAQPIKYNSPVSVPDVRIQRDAAIDRYNGNTVKKIASAVFDTAGTDSSGVSNKTIAAHGLGVYIPINAVITKVWYDVSTTFADGVSDAATIELGLVTQDPNAFIVAIAVSDASNVWDAGQHGSIVGSYALDGNAMTALELTAAETASYVKTTAERELVATVAVAALTLGKLVLYVEYVQSDLA